MNKFEELADRKTRAIKDQEQMNKNFEYDFKDIEEAIEKLEAEFIRKVKAPFRGVIVNVEYDNTRLEVSVGRTGLFLYREARYEYSDDLITRATAEKLKAVYIEYFGEL